MRPEDTAMAGGDDVRDKADMDDITLRDYFAAKALQGDWVADSSAGVFANDTKQEVLEGRAALYYRMADAMLKARQQQD